MRTALKNMVIGTRLEQPARRLRQRTRPRGRRRNAEEHQRLRALLLLSLEADAHCVDVGANHGSILEAIVRAAPAGRHVAFEPVPELRALLRDRFPMVDVRGEAVADRAGTAVFSQVPERTSRSGLAETLDLREPMATADVSVNTVRLDDVLVDAPALIKIDVEGAELEVLRGAREIIKAHFPLIAFEHQYGRLFDESRSTAVFDEFAGCGYRVFDMDGEEFDRSGFLGVVARRHRWNFIAHR